MYNTNCTKSVRHEKSLFIELQNEQFPGIEVFSNCAFSIAIKVSLKIARRATENVNILHFIRLAHAQYAEDTIEKKNKNNKLTLLHARKEFSSPREAQAPANIFLKFPQPSCAA